MKKIFLTTLVLLAGCAAKSPSKETSSLEPFAGKKGCFLLYNMKSNQFEKEIGGETCHEQFSASSTFKVPLSVMAFDAGVLKDENQILKWDGKKKMLPAWEKDHNAKTWMKESVVWFSQRLTPKIGMKKFKKYLKDFKYGNQDVEMKNGLTESWLLRPNERALKISPYEQVEFMKKLWRNELPASPKAQEITRELTYLETSSKGFKLNGKTGSNFYDEKRTIRLGWFIAHVEGHDKEYIAVTTFSDLAPTEAKGYAGMESKELTKKLLSESGLWE